MKLESSMNLHEINNYTLNEKVRWLRENHPNAKDTSKKGYMSTKVLAKKLDFSEGTLNKLEKGSKNEDDSDGDYNLNTIIKVADFFNVSIDWLCSRSSVSDTDYDLNWVCDYTGLSEQAVKNLRDFPYENATNKVRSDALDVINFFFSFVPDTAGIDEYFKRFTRTVHRYNSNIKENINEKKKAVPIFQQRVEQLKADSSMDYIFPSDLDQAKKVNNLEKDFRYNGFELQDLARDFINDYSVIERKSYNEISNRYYPLYDEMMELQRKNRKGGKHGNDQETK